MIVIMTTTTMTTTTIVERLSHHTLLRAASAIHARCRFSSIGLLGKLEVFLTQRIRFLENIALALTLPGQQGWGFFLLWLTSPTNEILVGTSDFFSLRAHDSH